MNNVIRETNGFNIKNIYYGDTDSLYIERDVLDKTKLVGIELCQGKDVYKTDSVFYGLILAPK